MKKILLIIPIALIFACGQAPVEQGKLGKLKAEKDSLKTIQKGLTDRIAEIDAIIQANDTTKKLTQISTLSVNKGTFSHFVDVYGNVEASENVTLYPEMAGKVLSIKVEEGQEVRKGQLLVKIDSDVLNGSLKEVKTNLELATTVFEKQEKLWKQKIGSEVQFLEAKARKESLESTKSQILAQIEMAEIRAPFSGIVDEIFPKVGEMASPQMPTVRLVNMDNVYIEADLSESYLTSVKAGTYVKVDFTTLKKSIESKVTQVGKFINPNNRTFKLKVEVPKTDFSVNPNLLAKISIKDFEIMDSALTVPTRIIQQNAAGEDFVMVLKNSAKAMVEKRIIKTGISYSGNTLINGGLKNGEILVDKGARSVKDGQEVEVQ